MGLNLNAIGQKFGPIQKEYSWKDIALYALGVGAGFDELEYVYEARLKVLPSFAILTIYDFFPQFIQAAGVNLAGILHGEHDLIIHNPIPPEGGKLESEGKITAMYDKGEGKGALVIGEITTYHEEGQKLFTNVVTLFSRLDGGFGGEPGPSETFTFPERPPDFEEVDTPSPDQPLIYRLSGDTFALHVDADFARMSGFEQPIMHGLCTHGFACRALIKHLFPGEAERLTRMRNRFTKALYPGTSIKTQIWKLEEGKALFRTLNAETDEVVIDRGVVEWTSSQEARQRLEARGVRFDGQVAIVTGAGGGLGRIYALELARRGAKVVVNDLGGSPDGSGASSSPAESVVQEIIQFGGTAIPNFDSVASPQGAQNLVDTTMQAFGRIDILINNAGILRDKSFTKMSPDMWHAVLDVHLNGAFYVTHPVFQIMRQQGYGRIVFTTSAAGLFGNFGQANYAAAKMGILGLMNTLKIEGEKYNIKLNTVAPLAATRLTQDVLPNDLLDQLKPEFVAPLVLYLCSDKCTQSGLILNAGMGYYGRAAIVSGDGIWISKGGRVPTLAEVHRHWQEIERLEPYKTYPDANTALMDMLTPKQGAQEAAPRPQEAPAAQASVASVFQRLPQAFQPQAAAGLSLVFQFSLSGTQGGEWHAIIQNQECTVQEGKHPNPTTTIKMSAEDFLEYVSGKLNAMQAYSSGRLKIEGDLMKSQLIGKLFKF